jgi:hypothetical protein
MTDVNNPVNPDRTFIEPKTLQLGPSLPSGNERLPIGSGVIVEKFGESGMGAVFKTRRKTGGRQV